MLESRKMIFVVPRFKFLPAVMAGLAFFLLMSCQKNPPSADQKVQPTVSAQVKAPGGPYEQTIHRPVPKAISVAVIFKDKEASAYRAAFRRGAESAAKEIGAMTLEFKEPDPPTVAAQIEILQRLRMLATDLMILDAADPYAVCPMIRKIRLEELQVITFESDCDPDKSHRLFWVSPVPTVVTGRLLANLAAQEIGTEGKIAIISAGASAIQPRRWLQTIKEQLNKNYPHVEITAIKYTDDDPAHAQAVTREILNEDAGVKTILVLSRHILPAVARAVEEAKTPGRVGVIGVGTPQSARPFFRSGTVRYLITWNPEDYGYFATYVARMVMDRRISMNSRYFIGRIGYVIMDGDEIPMAEPTVVTAETVDAYNF